jgi:DNA-binding transcriptional LysR family regulator
MQSRELASRRVKLNDLRVLMTVVQAGSMNKAAAVLHSTQPAISRSIKDLERTIGAPLLDRSPRGIEPTVFGKALLEGGTAMFDDFHRAMQTIEFLNDPTAGSVCVGCSPLLAATFVSAVVELVSRRFPRIRFELVSAPVEVVHRDLNERRLDFLITRQVGPILEDRLSFDFLFEDSLVVVCGNQHLMARRRNIALAQLAAEPWVLPPPDLILGAAIIEGFRKRGVEPPKATVITVSPEARMSLVSSGRFLTIFPESALKFSAKHSGMVILPVKLPLARVPVGIVALKNRMQSPVVRLFIQCAREVAKQRGKKSNAAHRREKRTFP